MVVLIILLMVTVGTIEFQTIQSVISGCHDVNEVRTEITRFVDSTLVRSRANYETVLKSPLSTQREKDTARKNLAGLDAVVQDEHTKLALHTCSYPLR